MKVLLVWEEVPESTKLFRLEGEMADLAIKAHGCFVNLVGGDPDGAADRLSESLAGVDPVDQDAGPVDIEGAEKIVIAGFVF